MWSALSRKILSLLGWTILGAHHARKTRYSVIAVAPHTSNWDFPLGLLVRSAAMLDTKYLGKKELFNWPFGLLFKKLGGWPVDRSGNTDLVRQIIEIFNQHKQFSITIAPEGTRSRVTEFKSGFYYIAREGGFAIILCAFDYGKKRSAFLRALLSQ